MERRSRRLKEKLPLKAYNVSHCIRNISYETKQLQSLCVAWSWGTCPSYSLPQLDPCQTFSTPAQYHSTFFPWLDTLTNTTFTCSTRYRIFQQHIQSHTSFTNRCTFIRTLAKIYIQIRWLPHVSVYDQHQGACICKLPDVGRTPKHVGVI